VSEEEAGGAELPPPPGMDIETGEVTDPDALAHALGNPPPGLPGQTGLQRMRKQRQILETPAQVEEALVAELRKLDLASERFAEVRKLLHGYYTPGGDYVAGTEFEYQEEYDLQVRDLYDKCHAQGAYEGGEKTRWPGEDVRTSIVNEHITQEHREKLSALKGELKTLETYITICKTRLMGLSTLLSYHKEGMKMAGHPQWQPKEFTS
jgi:hypothetical protein